MWRRDVDAGQELFVEWYGGGVAVSHRDDQPALLWRLLDAAFPVSVDLPIRYTISARDHPDGPGVLGELAVQAATRVTRRGAGRVLLSCVGEPARAGSGTSLAQRLAAMTAPVELVGDLLPSMPAPPAVLADGWDRAGARLYRRAGDPGLALAEVLPAGVLLRPGRVYAEGAVAVLDLPQWTVVIGSPGRPVPSSVVAMLRGVLLDAPADRVPLRLDVAGETDPTTAERIAALAHALGARGGTRAAATAEPASHRPSDAGGPGPGVALWPPLPEAELAPPGDAVIDGLLAWPPPEPDPSVALADAPAPLIEVPPPTAFVPLPGGLPPVVTIVDPDADSAAPAHHARHVAVTSVDADEGVNERPRALAEATTPPARWRAVPARTVAERPSTEDERRRFATALGNRFTDLLAVVNAAMATWPALRREAAGEAKADYVAVCLYLGASADGAVALNAALRSDAPRTLDGYLPCLVSGLNQLPLHRRAVLYQAQLGETPHSLYPVGAVLAEPAALSTSVTAGVTVSGADVDFLIWPRSARQASVLTHGEVGEAVFPPGSRFRVLAVHEGPAEVAADGAVPPPAAVLLRQLAPDEQPAGSEFAAVDETALRRLEETLAQRRAGPVQLIEDPDLAARLAGPPVGFVAARAANGRATAT